MKSIIINGVSVKYNQTKSDRRTISATVDDEGVVQVRTPKRVTDESVRNFLKIKGDRIILIIENKRERTKYEKSLESGGLDELKRRARDVIPCRVEYFSKIMGLRPASVKINAARTRFGSCSSRGNLNFSCRVMAYSANAVDYVIVHELSHMIHMNHGAEFWKTVERYKPDYKIARAELKKIPDIKE